MRFFILLLFYMTMISGCTTFPIEVDCGLECEEGTEPVLTSTDTTSQTVAHASVNSTNKASEEGDKEVNAKKEEPPPQPVMYASDDWRTCAVELANKINKELITRSYIEKSVYVKPACSDPYPCDPEMTAFNQAFRDFLITELVKLAVPTVESRSEDTVDVTYKAQVVRHGTREQTKFEKALVGSAKRFLADEVVITTSILLKNKYIFRDSGVYSIKDQDFWHYQDYGGEAATIRVAPKKKVAPQFNDNTEKLLEHNNELPKPIQQNS